MKPWLMLSLIVLGCNERTLIEREGCEGQILVDGVDCGSPCEVAATVELTAVSTEECRFVSWGGTCGSTAVCRGNATSGRAIFRRTSWPLHVDLLNAPGFSAVLSTGETCTSLCDFFVPVGETFTLQAVAPSGARGVWSGDCDSVNQGECIGTSSRERTVRLHGEADLLPVRLTVVGAGSVTIGSLTCGPNRICELQTPRGTEITAAASPEPGNAFIGWSRRECSSSTCAFVPLDPVDLSANFVPLKSISLTARGSGDVSVNGSRLSLPGVREFPVGTTLSLAALPQSDHVLFRFEGLPCRVPRVIDECTFELNDDVAGVVAFAHLHQWSVGGWNATLNSIEPAAVGAVVSLKANSALPDLGATQTARDVLVQVRADAGIAVLQKGQLPGFGPVAFRGVADRWWLASTLQPTAGATTVGFSWGSFDGGVNVRRPGAGQPVFLRLNAVFEVDAVTVVPLAPAEQEFRWSQSIGPPIITETHVLHRLQWARDTDAGSVGVGRATWDEGFGLTDFLGESSDADMARVGALNVMVSAVAGSSFRLDSCSLSNAGDALTAVSVLGADGTCLSSRVGSLRLDGGAVTLPQPTLVRDSDQVAWFEESGSFLNAQLRYVGMNATLATPLWQHSITAAPPARNMRASALRHGSFVFSFINVEHDAELVASSGDVHLRCPPALLRSSLVILRHRADGSADWGTCLAARSGDVARFTRMGLAPYGLRPVNALGGVLIGQSAQSNVDGTFLVGSTSLSLTGGWSVYLMLLTPPLDL